MLLHVYLSYNLVMVGSSGLGRTLSNLGWLLAIEYPAFQYNRNSPSAWFKTIVFLKGKGAKISFDE